MKWGPITWYFMHSLAEKIKDEEFVKKRSELLKIILLICSNLPCPECQVHAKDTFKYIRLSNIKTKDDFKELLWSFHNIVNRRKQYPQFSLEDCTNKYKQAQLDVIVRNFLIIWRESSGSSKLTQTGLSKTLGIKIPSTI